MKRHLIVMSAALLGSVVLTGLGSPAHAWNGVTTVQSVIVQPYAESLARFTGAPAHSCWNPRDGYHEYLYKIAGGNPTATEKLIYATLLSATLAHNYVYLVTGGACEYGYERIYSLELYQ